MKTRQTTIPPVFAIRYPDLDFLIKDEMESATTKQKNHIVELCKLLLDTEKDAGEVKNTMQLLSAYLYDELGVFLLY